MQTILFKHCALIDAATKTLSAPCDVLVQGNRIQEISRNTLSCSADTVYDLNGKTLMPGLIDAHVHVTAPTMDLASHHIPDSEIAIHAAHFLEAMLMRGFTSVRDAGGADSGLVNAINKGLIKGPRLFIAGKALSQTGGHGDFRKSHVNAMDPCGCASSASHISMIADGMTEVRKAVRDLVRKGVHQIKIMASGGVASPTDRITNLQYSLDEIRAIVEEAENAGIYVMAHAYTPEAIIRAVACGVRTIEHGNRLDTNAARVMAEKGAYLVPTLATYEALNALGPKHHFPAESLAKIEDVRKAGLEAIRTARAQGVAIGFGTDLIGVDAHTWQAKEFMIRSSVESPYDTIFSATKVNAEIVQHQGFLGTIVPGAYADLIVVDGNPLEDITLLAGQGEALLLIMKDGVIYKNHL